MIEKLKCEPNTPAEKLPENADADYEKAIQEYISFFDKMLTSKNSDKNRKTALGILVKMKKKTKSRETKNLLQIADGMVRRGNNVLAKKIIKLDEMNNEVSLFEVSEDDFNILIEREFSSLKQRSQSNQDTHSPQIVLSAINVQ